ncbi:MAG TPA: hypothetical protein VMY59_09675, partial [Candidatus Thermoplasmatota archaeon]|nr:hypothetical protein [Candidatus Thermoplasmatota archaeon]
MPSCPVCSKPFSTDFALSGHLRLSADQRHAAHIGKPPLKRRYKETQQKNQQRRLKQLTEENKTLKSFITKKNKDSPENNEKAHHQGREHDDENIIVLIKYFQEFREDFNIFSKELRELEENFIKFSEFIKEKIDQKELLRPTETAEKPSVHSIPTKISEKSFNETIELSQDLENEPPDILDHIYNHGPKIIGIGKTVILEASNLDRTIKNGQKTGVYSYTRPPGKADERTGKNKTNIMETGLPMEPFPGLKPLSNVPVQNKESDKEPHRNSNSDP